MVVVVAVAEPLPKVAGVPVIFVYDPASAVDHWRSARGLSAREPTPELDHSACVECTATVQFVFARVWKGTATPVPTPALKLDASGVNKFTVVDGVESLTAGTIVIVMLCAASPPTVHAAWLLTWQLP